MATRNSERTTVTARVASGVVALASFGAFFGLVIGQFVGL